MFIKIILIIVVLFLNSNIYAKNNRIIIASTTSINDTGLIDFINKEFNNKFNIETHVISLGTGQALSTAKRGDIDILIVHDTPSEIKFVEEGYGVARHNLMYNDYIIVGPGNDNSKCESIEKILLKIKSNKLFFVSRGDKSGTHAMEVRLWNNLNFEPNNFASWYIQIGQGMGQTLLLTNELIAYTLTDRSTWISFNNKKNLKIICENKPPLFNQYGIIEVKKDSKIKSNYSKKYINWIISDEGKVIINSFKKNNVQLFYFNHH